MTSWLYWIVFAVAVAGVWVAAVVWINARYQEARRRDRVAFRARYGTRPE